MADRDARGGASPRPPVVRDEQLAAVLEAVEAGKSFAGQRDAAILRVFIAGGARLSEVTNPR